MDEIPITDETIRLGQLLKLAGIIGAGAEAKLLLAEERVRVNGEVEDGAHHLSDEEVDAVRDQVKRWVAAEQEVLDRLLD